MALLGPVEASVQQDAIEAEHMRQRRIKRAWDAYYGQGTPLLDRAQDGEDDNVRLGLATTIVNKGVSLLLGTEDLPLQIVGDDEGTALDRLNEGWPVGQRSLALHQAAVNGGVSGQAVLRMHRNPLRVVVVDPATFEAEWDQDDIETVLEYRIQWTALGDLGEPYARRTRFLPGDTWLIVDERSTHGDVWDEIGREVWPFAWGPIFECQNLPAPNEYWGMADLEADVLDLIDAIDRVASRMARIIRLLGYPVPYITGESEDRVRMLDMRAGRLLTVPNQEAKVGQLELKADLTASVTMFDRLRAALHEKARIPEVASGKLENAGSLSGVALKVLYGPAVELNGTKHLTYGPMFRTLVSRCLEVLGQGKEREVTIPWPPVVPHDDQAALSTDESELRMGIVSKRTVAERRGYDWQDEQERIDEEREAAAEAAAKAFNGGNGLPGGADDDDEEGEE